MCSLKGGFVIPGFFSMQFIITVLKNMVRYTGVVMPLYRGSLYPGGYAVI